MARNFPDFLEAYFSYARDNFAPDRFHKWVGRSILAAALERKVSLKQGKVHHFPNIYVMLVSHPGVGKSTAMDAGTDLIETMKKEFLHNFRIIPNQATEPALIDMMNIIDRFALPGRPEVLIPQSAGYFYAREASNSALQNTCGNFVAALTEFYDCPRWFRKKLKGEKDMVEIENSCMNLLSGATFNYLKTLVNEQSVLGGFASRLIYVVAPEREVKETKWDESREYDEAMAKKLVEDLVHINSIIGPMRPTPGFISRYEAWKPQFDQYLIDLKSERLESIMTRKGTNLLKLCILLSVSESDSRVLTEEHFDRALVEIEDVYKDNPQIIAAAVMADKDSQTGLNQAVVQALSRNGGTLPMPRLKQIVAGNGNDVSRIKQTIDFLLESQTIRYEANDSSGLVTLLVDPDRYL